jgi:catechol 2,3-dioxygenase
MNYNNNSNKYEDTRFIVNPSLKINHVHLKVSNLQNSIEFYQSILGFKILENTSEENIVYLGSYEPGQDEFSSLLILSQIDNTNGRVTSNPSNIRREVGLYHLAILLPERKFLASFLQHIQRNLEPQYYEGMADHAVSESLYLHDPDNNGIEVYHDRHPSEWIWTGPNKICMTTEPLDVRNLLNHESYGEWSGFPKKTSIGHVHLRVSNLTIAKNFYQDMIGLYHTASYPGALFFAADRYHHHIATNTWSGTNIVPSSANNSSKVGLDHFAIQLVDDKKEKDSLKSQLTSNGMLIDEKLLESDLHQKSSFYIYDPDGIKIQIILS